MHLPSLCWDGVIIDPKIRRVFLARVSQPPGQSKGTIARYFSVTRCRGLSERLLQWNYRSSIPCQNVKMSQMLDEGVWAEIKVGGEHLRLFSERNALGVQASVYNVNTKSWIAPSELVDDVEQGKEKAAAYAAAHLKRIANLELPPLLWKRSRVV